MSNLLNKDTYLDRNTDVPSYENLTLFNTFYTNRYLDRAVGGTGFIFVTKPDLFINPTKPTDSSDAKDRLAYDNMCRDPYFTMFLDSEATNASDKEIIRELSYKDWASSQFIKAITNSANSIDIPDSVLETVDSFETKQGYRMPLPVHSTASESSGTLNIPLTETKNLDLMKIVSLWKKYCENISDGTFSANPDMIISGSLDYTSSIYYFLLDGDGRTIKYWAKFTGCYPTNIPDSSFKWSRGEKNLIEFDITFAYAHKEAMNPRILEDFNRVSLHNLNFYENSEDLDYDPIKNSELLDSAKLKSGRFSAIVNSESRDPLVFINKASTDTSIYTDNQIDRFELSFSEKETGDRFLKQRIPDYDFNEGVSSKLNEKEVK